MDTNIPSSRPVTTEADLASQLQGLKQLFYVAVFALIVLGVAVDIYLAKQMRLARAQLFEQRQNAARISQDFNSTSEPLIRNFVVALQGFAATNKDFEPIFNKYRGPLGKYLTGPVPAMPVSP